MHTMCRGRLQKQPHIGAQSVRRPSRLRGRGGCGGFAHVVSGKVLYKMTIQFSLRLWLSPDWADFKLAGEKSSKQPGGFRLIGLILSLQEKKVPNSRVAFA